MSELTIFPQCTGVTNTSVEEKSALDYLGLSEQLLVGYAVNAWNIVDEYSNDAEYTMMELMDNDCDDLFFVSDNVDPEKGDVVIKQAVKIYNELKPLLDKVYGKLDEGNYIEVFNMSGTGIVVSHDDC